MQSLASESQSWTVADRRLLAIHIPFALHASPSLFMDVLHAGPRSSHSVAWIAVNGPGFIGILRMTAYG